MLARFNDASPAVAPGLAAWSKGKARRLAPQKQPPTLASPPPATSVNSHMSQDLIRACAGLVARASAPQALAVERHRSRMQRALGGPDADDTLPLDLFDTSELSELLRQAEDHAGGRGHSPPPGCSTLVWADMDAQSCTPPRPQAASQEQGSQAAPTQHQHQHPRAPFGSDPPTEGEVWRATAAERTGPCAESPSRPPSPSSESGGGRRKARAKRRSTAQAASTPGSSETARASVGRKGSPGPSHSLASSPAPPTGAAASSEYLSFFQVFKGRHKGT